MKKETDENWKKCERCGVWTYAIIDYLCSACRRKYELEIEEENEKIKQEKLN
jgi:ribosomal protein L37E